MVKNALVLVLALATPLGGALAIPSSTAAQDGVREIEVVVRGGYQPSRIVVREGERVRLRFVRQEHASCSREVVFGWLGIRRELPPNQPVVIELPPMTAGEYEFRCGMNMLRGTVVVEPR